MFNVTPIDKSVLSVGSNSVNETFFRVISYRNVDAMGYEVLHNQQLIIDFHNCCVFLRGSNQLVSGYVRPDMSGKYVCPESYKVLLGDEGMVITATTKENLIINNVRSFGERVNFNTRYLRSFAFEKDSENPYVFTDATTVSISLAVDFVITHPIDVYLQIIRISDDRFVVGKKDLVCWTERLGVEEIAKHNEVFGYCLDTPVEVVGSGIAIVASRNSVN